MQQSLAVSAPAPAGGLRPPPTSIGRRPDTLRQGSDVLYPLDFVIRYETLDGRSATGCGRTVQIGSRKVVFASEQILEVNRKIRFSLDWPVALADGVGLKFWASGMIVKVDSGMVTVAYSRHEFRTCRR
jgi:hypothetical protein